MSADNGVYILTTSTDDGGFEHRVTHAQAIDNIEYDPDYEQFNKKELILYFGNCIVHTDISDAEKEAYSIYEELIDNGYIVEYGICYIDARDITFPSQN